MISKGQLKQCNVPKVGELMKFRFKSSEAINVCDSKNKWVVWWVRMLLTCSIITLKMERKKYREQ